MQGGGVKKWQNSVHVVIECPSKAEKWSVFGIPGFELSVRNSLQKETNGLSIDRGNIGSSTTDVIKAKDVQVFFEHYFHEVERGPWKFTKLLN